MIFTSDIHLKPNRDVVLLNSTKNETKLIIFDWLSGIYSFNHLFSEKMCFFFLLLTVIESAPELNFGRDKVVVSFKMCVNLIIRTTEPIPLYCYAPLFHPYCNE